MVMEEVLIIHLINPLIPNPDNFTRHLGGGGGGGGLHELMG